MKNKTRKSKKILMVAAIALMVALVAAMGTMTYSRYVSSSDLGSQQATAAKWGLSVQAVTTNFLGTDYSETNDDGVATMGEVTTDGVAVNAFATDVVVAPGTSGFMTIEVDGSAEVLAKLTIAMEYTADISATTGGNTYNPVKWTLSKSTDGGTNYTDVVGAVNITLEAMESKIEAQSAYITAGQPAQVILKLSWAWALESGADAAAIAANNKHDTAIGMFSNGADLDDVNTALGTAYTAITKSFTFSLSATITQEQTEA